MKRLDTPLIRILKYLTAVMLAAVVVIVAVNFFFRTQNRTTVETRAEGPDLTHVEEKRKIRHLEEEGGRPVLEFEAERHYRGPDEYYHLEGNVKVNFLQPGQKDDILFYGEEILHDEELEWFQVNGKARIESEDMTVQAASLRYDSLEGEVIGEKGILFDSSRLTGQAETAKWKVRRKELILENEVHLEMRPEQESSPSVIVECGEMEYLRKWGHGFLRGDVEVRIGEHWAQADVFEFRLTTDREFLRSVKMQGNVSIHLSSAKSEDVSPQEETYDALEGLLQNGEKSFVSEEIHLVFFHDMVKVQEFRSNRECEVKSVSDKGDSMQLVSEELRFRLNPEGGLKEFNARGQVRMREDKTDSDSFQIEAGTLRIKDRKHVLEILKGNQAAAKVMAPGFEIWGGNMDYFLNNRNLEVKNGVDVILKSSESTNPGFFSANEPLFIKSEEMRYIPANQRFFFKGETKFWQKKEILESRSLILDKENGKVIAREGVRSVFHYQPEEKAEEKRFEITAMELDYRPYQNDILFKRNCTFYLEEAILKAEEISLLLGEEKGKIKGVDARNGVTITQGMYAAQGRQAFFSVPQNEILLTGKPVLIDKNRGRTEGDKLTFSLSDDRIIVENQGRERSLTVIK